MTPEQALEAFDQLRRKYRGLPEEHEFLAQAILCLKDAISLGAPEQTS